MIKDINIEGDPKIFKKSVIYFRWKSYEYSRWWRFVVIIKDNNIYSEAHPDSISELIQKIGDQFPLASAKYMVERMTDG